MNRRFKFFFIIVTLIIVVHYIFQIRTIEDRTNRYFDQIPKEIKSLSIQSLEKLKINDFDYVRTLFVSQEDNGRIEDIEFQKLADDINHGGDIKGKTLIWYGGESITYDGKPTNVIVYDIECENGYLKYAVTVAIEDEDFKILKIETYCSKISAVKLSEFGLNNKGIEQYAFLIFGLLNYILVIFTASIIFAKKQKRYIVWTIMSFWGIGIFSLNWTYGKFFFQYLNFGFPIFDVQKIGFYTPYICSFHIPIVTYFYWFKEFNKEKRGKVISEL